MEVLRERTMLYSFDECEDNEDWAMKMGGNEYTFAGGTYARTRLEQHQDDKAGRNDRVPGGEEASESDRQIVLRYAAIGVPWRRTAGVWRD